MKQIELCDFGIAENRLYNCQYDWSDCNVQGGDMGVVFTDKGNYKTAFFESFPKDIDDYFRGEGSTIEEAETDAWEKYRKIVNCIGHEYEKRGHTSGVGFCKHCSLRKYEAFEPDQYCEICNKPTNWTRSKTKKWYCEEHKDCIPEEDKTDWQKGKAKNLLDTLFGSLK